MRFDAFTPVSPYRIRLMLYVDAQLIRKASYTIVGFARNDNDNKPEMVALTHTGALQSLDSLANASMKALNEDAGISLSVIDKRVEVIDIRGGGR